MRIVSALAVLLVWATPALPAAEVAVSEPGWSVLTIGAFATAVTVIIGAIGTAVVKIIRALNDGNILLRDTKRIVVAGQVAAVAAGVVSAEKQQEIHLLVNNNLLTKMRAALVLMKREYERTKKESDREAWEVAETELRDAEASALTVSRLQISHAQDNRTSAARAELEASHARAGDAPDAHARWVLSLEQIVALTKESAERTKLPAEQALYKQSLDNLTNAQKMN